MTSYGSRCGSTGSARRAGGSLSLDEAQAIKNPDAKQTRAVKALEADSRIALTGTPIENNLRDLWSIFDFLNPGTARLVEGLRRLRQASRRPGAASYAPLRKLVAPYILRRLKTDRSVIADLPDKTEVKAFCGLSRRSRRRSIRRPSRNSRSG